MELISELLGVKKIVHQFEGAYDDTIGVVEGDVMYTFLTNFRSAKLPVYLTAIKQSGLNPEDFAIHDEAYGFNEDTGARWRLDDDYRAFFYNVSHDDLQVFHRAMKEVESNHLTFKHA